MKRNFLQDVIPPSQKRSIRNIPISRMKKDDHDTRINHLDHHEHHSRMDDVRTAHRNTPPPVEKEDNFFPEEQSPKKNHKFVIFMLLILVLPFVLFFGLRTKAEVFVKPKIESFYSTNTFQIFEKDKSVNVDDLVYKVSNVEKESSTMIKSTGKEEVKTKATGKIKIFNENTKEPQNLIKNTRFESKGGLIFRINNSVSVPGYKETNGKKVPGEIEVEIFAEEEGDKYNIGSSDFTIPGFKDYPDKFKNIYAKSITDLSGGFIGVKNVVSENDKKEALEKLKLDIKNQIINELKQSSEGFIVAFDESKINYSKISEENSGEEIKLSIKSNLDVYIFSLDDFSNFMRKKLLPNTPDGEVIITNPQELKIQVSTVSDEETKELKTNVYVEGNINFEWVIDSEEISKALVNQKRNNLMEVIGKFQSISQAESNIWPYYINTFPKDSSRIKITIKK